MKPDGNSMDWDGNGPKDHGVATAFRDFVALDGRYILGLNGTGIEFEIDRLRQKWGEVVGELTVRCNLAGARTIDDQHTISVADLSLGSVKARQERATLLDKRSQAPTIDWFGLLEEFVGRVLGAYRAGRPAVRLRDLPRPAPDPDMDVDGFRLLLQHPVILFGDGGAAKSYLALYFAGRLAQRGHRICYFDWEFSGEEHRDRLERLFGSSMPDLLYARCDRPLVSEVDRLRRIVQDEHIDYGIFDSVAFACDGPPEAAESTAAYFGAIRQLGIGGLHVAHVNKSDNGDMKPFGSSFWHNGARATWFAKRSEESQDGRHISVGLFNRKANTGPLRPAIAFGLSFEEDRAIVERVDIGGVQDLAVRLPLKQRMVDVLRRGPMTLAALAEELEAKAGTIETTARRWCDKGTFTRVHGSDGVTRLALVERRMA